MDEHQIKQKLAEIDSEIDNISNNLENLENEVDKNNINEEKFYANLNQDAEKLLIEFEQGLESSE